MCVRFTYEYVENYIKSHGYKLLSKEYINKSEKIDIMCDKGHVYSTSFGVFRKGFKCPYCSKKKKYTYDEVKSHVESIGYRLLSTEYKNANAKLEVMCDKGHVYKVKYSDFNNKNYRCKKCQSEKVGRSKSYSYEYIKSFIENKGYKLVSDDYINNREKLDILCKEGHLWNVTFDTFRNSNCPHCQNKVKYTHSQVKKYMKRYGYKLISNQYINNSTKLEIMCPNNHIYEATFSMFKNDDNRCPICSESKGENKVCEVLDILNIDYIKQHKFDDCKFKNKLPFDFYLPEYNLCIEYDGELHYKMVEHFGGIDGLVDRKIRDVVKDVYCKNNNIELLRIPYWDFDNIEKIINNKIINMRKLQRLE